MLYNIWFAKERYLNSRRANLTTLQRSLYTGGIEEFYMRRIPIILTLFLASSAVLAQDEGIMIFKSEQPYVSPFDKAPSGRPAPAATLFPPAAQIEIPQGEGVNVEVREIERQETQKRAQAFVAKPAPKSPVRKAEPTRRVEELRVAVKKEEIPAVTKIEPKNELKQTVVKAQAKVEASTIPPKSAQNITAELAPPPAALSVKENSLTRFDKDSAPKTASVVGAATAIAAELTSPDTAAQLLMPATLINETDAYNSQSDSGLPGWLLKAVMFFMIGGLLMLGVWYWIKNQALYGDPAFQDPWFRPVKSR